MKSKLFHRNFSLLIAGQASSLLGNGILDFAMSMYVLDKTGSAAVYAGFLTASMIPGRDPGGQGKQAEYYGRPGFSGWSGRTAGSDAYEGRKQSCHDLRPFTF